MVVQRVVESALMHILIDTLLVFAAGSILIPLYAFGLLSLREAAPRAGLISFASGTLGALPFVLGLVLPFQAKWVLAVGYLAALVIGAILFTLPIGRIETGRDTRRHRFDERNVVFARARLKPNSEAFNAYYVLHPEKRSVDDRMRAQPGLLSSASQKAHPLFFSAAKASFDLTEAVRNLVNGDVAAERYHASPEAFTRFVKGVTLLLGAQSVGITTLNPNHIYSHIGRGTGKYGAPIELNHRFAIAFTVEMSDAMMACAPDAPVILESARKYVDAAVIAITIADYCRRLGYPARAHIDGNYRLIAPLVARDAGLGEIGRMGILITPKIGPRVRLGVVTTNMPLCTDERLDGRSILDFCQTCSKCADLCPSRAIPKGDRLLDENGLRWKLDKDKCFHYWNVIGTDCGVCMAVCPYSHPENWAHNLMRAAVKRSGVGRRLAVRLDDLLYGREPPHHRDQGWLPPREP
jgi:reductive dehalogenase